VQSPAFLLICQSLCGSVGPRRRRAGQGRFKGMPLGAAESESGSERAGGRSRMILPWHPLASRC